MPRTQRIFLLAIMLIFLCLLGSPIPATSAATVHAARETREQERIDTYIHARMQAAHIPGLALGVVRGDRIVYLKGYGIAGPDGRVVTPQTPFILGSTSKSITALAIMQLVEAGRIDLDAPVTTYLPWFRTADAAASARITARHLLYQNSGLPVDVGRAGFDDDNRSDTALEDGVRRLAGVQLSNPPGQAYEYANENYTILGLIIQAVSGSSYEQYIESAIFAPLDMRHSAATITDPSVSDIAAGHRYWFGRPVAFAAPYPRQMTPAGLLISSAEDMSQYLIAHLNGGTYGDSRTLSPAGVATLHSAGAPVSATSAYGMGWLVGGQAGAARLEHSGDVSNFHSNLLLFPDEQLGIVVLVNANGMSTVAALDILIDGVAAIVRGQGLEERVDPPVDRLRPLLPLAPLLVLVIWIIGSYVVIWHRQRHGELPARGMRRLWRDGVPLGIDLALATLGWPILPQLVHTPMATIRLFAPDVFLGIVLLSVLGTSWALARTILSIR
ncbi:MAG TPA: serine hydrolase domain-containing protein [Roseiflexaceae bacterium]|nr:serine hydrolase domain-containing protein [Roseiflexaceae bacterium]